MTIAEVQTAPAMSAARLYEALLRGDALLILDVRNPSDFARWRVEGRADLIIKNIPYYDFIEDEDAAMAQVPADRPVLVVCAKEGSSQYVATLLRERGLDASYLEGGILSWGHLYDTRDVVRAAWGRIVQIARRSQLSAD
jgi:rhodanese-related sulfurtransferase